MGHQERYQTQECSIAQLQTELQQLANQYLRSSDQILVCLAIKAEGFDKGFLGEQFQWVDFSASICTQNRAIRVSHSFSVNENKWKDSSVCVELSTIESVTEDFRSNGREYLDLYSVKLSGRGNQESTHLFHSSQESSKFANIVRNAVAQTKAKTQVSLSPNSVEARIRTLKQMRQDGLITEAQFQQKIQEIVNQL